ncbi:hypothetical protein [Stutzerimonas kunmingensis]|nr:hypothetical protein [Stutzerimonas kunmingensis]
MHRSLTDIPSQRSERTNGGDNNSSAGKKSILAILAQANPPQ